MQDAQELYRKTVSQLPPEERLRLAALILSELTEQPPDANHSALSLLDKMPVGRLFKTSEETDEYLREERDSWEH
ncbi:MAG TPA: hypothetical protein VKB86_22355 [Pyrinomonadaceae bacterium]|nr:hypothetical protein [Pyrinomonadaceae bacterium]